MKTPYNTTMKDLENITDIDSSEVTTHHIPLRDLCKDRIFVLGLTTQFLVFAGLSSLQPTLALHLIQYEDFSRYWIGIYFSIMPLGYIISKLLVSSYSEELQRNGLVFLGLICFTLSFLLIGTSPSIGLQNNPSVILLGLLLIGSSSAMISIQILPELIQMIKDKHPSMPDEDLKKQI